MGIERVTILGANGTSSSIALGLKAHSEQLSITGFDPDASAATRAHKQGIFDRVVRRLDRSCRNADLVIVSLPLTSIQEAFAAIAPHLQPGCLVTDTAPLKIPVLRWAKELLPNEVSFIGGHLIPNPAIVGFRTLEMVEEPGADLLKGALYYLVPLPGTPQTVIETFTRLAELLSAQPLFIDATEHDGLQAGAEDLPGLLAVALIRSTLGAPGWKEMVKFAGYRLAVATEASDSTIEQSYSVFLNRENVLLHLNAILGELVQLRENIANGNAEGIETAFMGAAEIRAHWFAERERGMWTGERDINLDHAPSAGERLGHLLFGNRLLVRKRRKPERFR